MHSELYILLENKQKYIAIGETHSILKKGALRKTSFFPKGCAVL